MSMTIDQLNRLGQTEFVRALVAIYDQAPWVAEAAWTRRPFTDSAHLHAVLCEAVKAAPEPDRVALVRAQPDLVGRAMRANRALPELPGDKDAPGLSKLSIIEIEAFQKKNGEYRYKFGFPFVISANQRSKAEIFAEIDRRLNQTPAQELEEALAEIAKIAWLRLGNLVAGQGAYARMTIQVLDQVNGLPAERMTVELWDVQGDKSFLITSRLTNIDGRTEEPLLASPELKPGEFILQLYVGEYFAARGSAGSSFLHRVQVRFTVTDTHRSWNLIVACAPGGYSFWRA